jgi:hypothetical protein
MQNTIHKTSKYQKADTIKYPIQIDPATAYQFCEDESCKTNRNYVEDIFTTAPYNLNVSNQVGNGIGTESFQPKTLQEKIELIHQQKVPYVDARNAPPAPIPLSDIINDNADYTFQNKQLSGGPSARSAIPAVIAPPSHSEEYWKTNDFLVRSGINSETVTDLTRSGYLVQSDQNDDSTKVIEPYTKSNKHPSQIDTMSVNAMYDIKTGETRVQGPGNVTLIDNLNDDHSHNHTDDSLEQITHVNIKNGIAIENYKPPCNSSEQLDYKYTTNLQQQGPSTVMAPPSQCSTNNYDIEATKPCKKELVTVAPAKEEMINMPYGYNADQLEISNLPSNLPTGMIQRNPVFNTYNKDIFTTTIQPGVYSRTEVVEPLNSNIGISFPQQFQPVECEKTGANGVTFVQKDSRITPINQVVNITPPGPDESNVYDPRFTGYGTNYRSYIDDVTGQPRFYYDDVMVHRQNNYITRNKLDFTDFGRRNNEIDQQYSNSEIRNLAQNTYTDEALGFRTELQSRLLRKVNVNSWQQKVAPISLGGGRR